VRGRGLIRLRIVLMRPFLKSYAEEPTDFSLADDRVKHVASCGYCMGFLLELRSTRQSMKHAADSRSDDSRPLPTPIASGGFRSNGTLSPLKEPEDAAETAMRFRIPLSIIFLPEEPFYLFKGLSLCLG